MPLFQRIYKYLKDLLDVSISSPTDGQVLKYQASSSKWVNGSASASTPTLDQVLSAGAISTQTEMVGSLQVTNSNVAIVPHDLDGQIGTAFQLVNRATLNGGVNNVITIHEDGTSDPTVTVDGTGISNLIVGGAVTFQTGDQDGGTQYLLKYDSAITGDLGNGFAIEDESGNPFLYIDNLGDVYVANGLVVNGGNGQGVLFDCPVAAEDGISIAGALVWTAQDTSIDGLSIYSDTITVGGTLYFADMGGCSLTDNGGALQTQNGNVLDSGGDAMFGNALYVSSGSVQTTNNFLDDGSGNMTVVKLITDSIDGSDQGLQFLLEDQRLTTDTGMFIDDGQGNMFVPGYLETQGDLFVDGVLRLDSSGYISATNGLFIDLEGTPFTTGGGTVVDDGGGQLNVASNTTVNGALLVYGAATFDGGYVFSNGSGILSVLGLVTPVNKQTANYTATAGDSTILVNSTTKTITLPTAVNITGRTYTIKLIASSTTATVATTSSQHIDASTTYTLSAQWKYVTVQSDGANWFIIANN